jgi:hypothetical protein
MMSGNERPTFKILMRPSALNSFSGLREGTHASYLQLRLLPQING